VNVSVRLSFSAVLCLAAGIGATQSYSFANWIYSPGMASASVTGYGQVDLTTTGANMNLAPYDLQFDNVGFTPIVASGVGGENPVYDQNWSFTLDLSSLADSAGLILGVGNFGHDPNPGDPTNYPGYRLRAYDTVGSPIGLGGITQIGSYDHTWLSPNPGWQFNDDVSLNTGTGVFMTSTTAGLEDHNSDIAYLTLPTGIGKLMVETVGPSSGDTVNVVVTSVPEPMSLSVLGLGALMLARRRRGRP